jgi:predicted anti-sigma-YlaC factor YlaD
MTHPEELLADFVDGTLADDERAVVDAHLQACTTCREEVAMSRTALDALAALQEEPVPLGVTGPVLAEAGRRFERRRDVVWKRVQWVAGAAAAAAIVAVVAVNLGGPSGERDATDRAGAGAEAPAGGGVGGQEDAVTEAGEAMFAFGLEDQRDVTYDAVGVRSLAEDAAERARTEGPISAPAPAAESTGATSALECLRASGAPIDEPTDTLVRLLRARFDDTPAYFAVFLESPGADQPPDTVVVWVTARDDCGRILHTAFLPI